MRWPRPSALKHAARLDDICSTMSLAATREDSVTPEAAPAASADTAPKRILFVDEKPDAFEGLKAAMRPLGTRWRLEFAAGGDEALAALAERPADVLIAEEQMSAMDGVTLRPGP